MEVNRQELSEKLKQIMWDSGETPKLYFQPPESVKLEYPCIVYHLRTMTSDYADDLPYRVAVGFDITYITRSPNSRVVTAITKLPYISFDRYYVSDNLHHYAYTFTSTMKEETND